MPSLPPVPARRAAPVVAPRRIDPLSEEGARLRRARRQGATPSRRRDEPVRLGQIDGRADLRRVLDHVTMRGADRPEPGRAKFVEKVSAPATPRAPAFKPDGALSVRDVADRLGVSRARIDQFIRDGRLAVVKVSGRVWIDPGDLDRFEAIPRSPGSRSSSPRTPTTGR
jgi:excisionase family DNA binding protein